MRIVYHHRTRATDAQRIHILEMVRALKDLGHEVEIVSLVPTDKEQDNAERDATDAWWQTVVRRIPFAYETVQIGYNVVGLFLLLTTLLRRRADFIYERYSLFNFTGVLGAKLLRIPIILEVNSPFALEQQRDRNIRAFRFAAWSEQVICNSATQVIVVSTPLRKMMVDAGVEAGKIVVMPNGVRTEMFCAGVGSPELRSQLGIDGKITIGFVGWFRKWHGLELLVEAFSRAGLADLNAALLLIGDGPAMDDLKETVRQKHLEQHVIFTGAVPHAQVPRYLDLVDIAVQPAANEYCCPMKILEYMALGKPTIAPRQENIEDVLTEGESALLFTKDCEEELGSTMGRLVRDGGLRLALAHNARKAIAQRGLTWRGNAEAVVELIGVAAGVHQRAGVVRKRTA